MRYDVIGDVHGHAGALITLLGVLDYRRRGGVYAHPGRQAVFVGDLIDRGPRNREVIDIVRAMVDAGSARVAMGNHELNAIQYVTPGADGQPLRTHTDAHVAQHRTFLDEYERDPQGWADAVAWFRTLPVYLDLGGLRVAHAYWSDAALRDVAPWLDAAGRLTDQGLAGSVSAEGTPAGQALRALLLGPEYVLPDALAFTDLAGRLRRRLRVRWWAPRGTPLRDALLRPLGFDGALPADTAEAIDALLYPHDAPPVCFGHYWLQGEARPLAGNVACVDYSVARWGRLVAYRWDGEAQLDAEKFVGVSP